jgi:hypothetical protein
MGLTNTGKKRKSESQVEGGSTANPNPTPTQDDVEAPLLPKKKKTCTNRVDNVEYSPSTTHAIGRNSHGAPSNMKKMERSSKKRPTDEIFVNANLATPAHLAKKAKVDKVAALNRAPQALRRSGKITSMLKDTC